MRAEIKFPLDSSLPGYSQAWLITRGPLSWVPPDLPPGLPPHLVPFPLPFISFASQRPP